MSNPEQITTFSFEDSDSRNKAAERLIKKWGDESIKIKWGSFEFDLLGNKDIEEAREVCRLYGGKVKE